MSVVTEFEDAGPCRKKVTIEVPAPAVEAEFGRVIQDLRQRVVIDGFRRGKVPLGVIRRRFKDEIKQEVVDRLLPRYWRQAEAEKSLDAVMPPQISDLEVEEGEVMKFVAEVDLKPEVALAIEEPIELPDPDIEPTDAEVEEMFDDLRGAHATWHPIERAAAVGDAVTGTIQLLEVDGEAHVDEETGEPDAPSPFQIEVGDENVWEELRLAVTGLEAGKQATFERNAPAGAGAGEGEPGESQTGKKLSYRIEVEEVRERELPELDDELARKAGDFETLDELREAIVERIRHGKRDGRWTTRRTKMLETLRERHPIELPGRLVDHETESMVREQMHRLAGQGVDLEKAEIDWMKIAEQIKPQAEHRVHEQFILDAIAEERDVRVDEQAFEGLIGMWAAQEKTSRLALRQQMAEDGRLAEIRNKMRRDRALAQLTGEEDERRAASEAAKAAAEAKAAEASENADNADDAPASETEGAAASEAGTSE